MLAFALVARRHGDRLSLASRELSNLGVDVRHVDVYLVEVAPGELADLALVEQPQGSGLCDLVVEEQVGEDRQLGNECKVLVDRLDPVRGGVLDRVETDVAALDQEATVIGCEKPAQDLDEGTLARAIVPDQAEHLTRMQAQVDATQHREGPEALGDAFDLEHDLGTDSTAVHGYRRFWGVVHHLVPSVSSSACARPSGQATRSGSLRRPL